jgi:nucleoside-diphosphate-sugar epimerase
VPKRFLHINVDGHVNLLMACRHHDVRRIVYASSAEVYGNPPPGPIREDHPLGAANTYAVSKLAADRLCCTLHREHGIPVVAARLFNAYGPRESEPYVIPEIIAQVHAGDALRLGNVEARRDFTHVSDTARGLVAVMKSDIEPGTAVNIGSGATSSVREVAEMIGEVFGRSIEIVKDERRLRPHDIEHLQADVKRLRERTGFAPEITLRDGLEQTVRWFAENGHRWPFQDRVVDER